MLRNFLVLALLILAPCTTFAEDLDCQPNGNGDLTLQAFTNCLIQKHGGEAIVTNGTIVGADSSGKELFHEEYMSGMSSQSLVITLVPVCKISTTIYSQLSGSFNYNWCATPTVSRQATREKWYFQLGRWRLIEQKPYNCNVSAELAAMPSQVQAVVCPLN